MIVQMHFDELNRLLSEYERVGFMMAVKAYEPARDLIRRSELLAWLKLMYVDMDEFRRLEKMGEIKPRRKGSAPNSPLFYSKQEVMGKLTRLKYYRALQMGGGDLGEFLENRLTKNT